VNKYYSHNGTQTVHCCVHAIPSVDPTPIQFYPVFALINPIPVL